MGEERVVSACLIIIGNEILSGRTVDANLPFLAKELGEIGIRMREVRIVPDVEAEIVAAVNECRRKHDYVFTTGGIGPTHDDITAASVARAFGLPCRRHPEAERRLLAYYPPEKVNEARLKMAETPEGAELIDNPVSVAPGFRIENVYVLPGVPSIMQAMFAGVKSRLRGGARVRSRAVTVYAPEGEIAKPLGAIQAAYPGVEIGSYPFMRMNAPGTAIVFRGSDAAALARPTATVAVPPREGFCRRPMPGRTRGRPPGARARPRGADGLGAAAARAREKVLGEPERRLNINELRAEIRKRGASLGRRRAGAGAPHPPRQRQKTCRRTRADGAPRPRSGMDTV
jgi:molybdenum cofactor synthesis domain-containing protein